ncbi:uncharacterized protein PITG_07074 [Phytophthora infestans T30-4]|uniref:C2CD3 N-terminal C2 domain-containing protein n=1 Tax=Phytophthora infestans (strain T30-4) TaxID=403677 RepID=D0N773_PHYIT|nr:uncharacterized protein PITG_07074 [Phytophthora infestans T30-4]EEY53422.1 conserved hypothetical protein [Phytophthora infestans T30-4]|eukprot:XP_002905040.1 conserved hypothetical protein [Phytophthora infestans T30-4]
MPQELTGASLPPKVSGHQRGIVTLCVAHILPSAVSSSPLPRESLVRVRWWGEEAPGSLFRPSLLSGDGEAHTGPSYSPHRIIAMKYPVNVQPEQLLEYFHDMGHLTLDVIDRDSRRKFGECWLPLDLHRDNQNRELLAEADAQALASQWEKVLTDDGRLSSSENDSEFALSSISSNSSAVQENQVGESGSAFSVSGLDRPQQREVQQRIQHREVLKNSMSAYKSFQLAVKLEGVSNIIETWLQPAKNAERRLLGLSKVPLKQLAGLFSVDGIFPIEDPFSVTTARGGLDVPGFDSKVDTDEKHMESSSADREGYNDASENRPAMRKIRFDIRESWRAVMQQKSNQQHRGWSASPLLGCEMQGQLSQVLFALHVENGFFGTQSRETIMGEARLNLYESFKKRLPKRQDVDVAMENFELLVLPLSRQIGICTNLAMNTRCRTQHLQRDACILWINHRRLARRFVDTQGRDSFLSETEMPLDQSTGLELTQLSQADAVDTVVDHSLELEDLSSSDDLVSIETARIEYVEKAVQVDLLELELPVEMVTCAVQTAPFAASNDECNSIISERSDDKKHLDDRDEEAKTTVDVGCDAVDIASENHFESEEAAHPSLSSSKQEPDDVTADVETEESVVNLPSETSSKPESDPREVELQSDDISSSSSFVSDIGFVDEAVQADPFELGLQVEMVDCSVQTSFTVDSTVPEESDDGANLGDRAEEQKSTVDVGCDAIGFTDESHDQLEEDESQILATTPCKNDETEGLVVPSAQDLVDRMSKSLSVEQPTHTTLPNEKLDLMYEMLREMRGIYVQQPVVEPSIAKLKEVSEDHNRVTEKSKSLVYQTRKIRDKHSSCPSSPISRVSSAHRERPTPLVKVRKRVLTHLRILFSRKTRRPSASLE